jgi:hypothetical protein
MVLQIVFDCTERGELRFVGPGVGVTPKEVAPDGSLGVGYCDWLSAGCKGRA